MDPKRLRLLALALALGASLPAHADDGRPETIGVLHASLQPTTHYRYLRTWLRQSGNIAAHSVLLSADPSFPQPTLPAGAAALARYDVVVIESPRSLRSDAAGRRLLALLPDFVRNGGGMICLAPDGLARELTAVLPVIAGAPVTRRGQLRTTAAGTRLKFPTATTEMQGLIGVRTRPGATSLVDLVEGERVFAPLVVAGTPGAGRSLFVGTDDLWRLRRGTTGFQRFWSRAIDWADSR